MLSTGLNVWYDFYIFRGVDPASFTQQHAWKYKGVEMEAPYHPPGKCTYSISQYKAVNTMTQSSSLTSDNLLIVWKKNSNICTKNTQHTILQN